MNVDSIHHSLSRTKRLSKYSSMNENHRRTSLTFSRTKNVYTKHTSSMKEIKSRESFVRPLKTSTQLCLTELTHSSSSSCSSGSGEQPVKKIKMSIRRLSDVENYTLEHEHEDVEEKRRQTNDIRQNRGSTNPVESPENSDLRNLDSSSSSSLNPDEHEQKFKVIKEFERNLEFVKNASNLKSILSDKKNDDTLKQPHIALSSLYYDKDNTNIDLDSSDDDYENDDNDDDEDDDEDDEDEDDNEDNENDNDHKIKIESNKPKVNLIINCSVSSEVSSSHGNEKVSEKKSADFVDDEMSMFKNETLTKNKVSDYVTFKKPLLPDMRKSNPLPMSLQPVQIQSNEYLLKKNKIYNELKVFNYIGNLETTTVNGVSSEMPKNSTPIYPDNSTAALLTAKRKKLLNGKLDLTIAPAADLKTSNYGTAKRVAKENFVTSTLRSSNNLITGVKKSSKLMSIPGETLDLSKLSAIENASTNLISVAKAEFPVDIKKKFKEEIRKDKTKCIIQ